jgi:hypothetical protein
MKNKHRLFCVTALVAQLMCTSCEGVLMDQTDEGQDPSAPAVSEPAGITQSENLDRDLIPDGVLVNTDNQVSLTYLDIEGHITIEIQTPGIGSPDLDNVAIAGPMLPDQPFPPVVYRSWEPEQGLMANINGQVSTLRQTNSFLSIVSSPGEAPLAFSEIEMNEDNLPHSFLFSGDPGGLGKLSSFYDLVDAPYYWALKPVGVRTVGGQAQGVWYTKTGWGIGGADLIFPITKELFFFDLTNGDNKVYLGVDRSFQGISPDLSYAGSVDVDMNANRAMTVINLTNSQQTIFPLDPSSDRGAGWVVFSPDNQFAGWMEASGSMISDPYDFHPRVRVGDIKNGGVVASLEADQALSAINGSVVSFMRPAGWLNNTTMLIEVRGENWRDATLLRFDITNGTISVFASGSFVTFGYQ